MKPTQEDCDAAEQTIREWLFGNRRDPDKKSVRVAVKAIKWVLSDLESYVTWKTALPSELAGMAACRVLNTLQHYQGDE